MGFWSKLFGREAEPVSDEIKAARERHGIKVEDGEKKKTAWPPPEKGKYDAWEEMSSVRSSFFMGSWASRRLKWMPDKDALKADLEEAERKREEKQRLKEEKKRGKSD